MGSVAAFTVAEILANHVFDRVSGKELDRQARKAARRLNTRPSHGLADFAGDYGHPGYGRITITHAEGKLNWAYRGIGLGRAQIPF